MAGVDVGVLLMDAGHVHPERPGLVARGLMPPAVILTYEDRFNPQAATAAGTRGIRFHASNAAILYASASVG